MWCVASGTTARISSGAIVRTDGAINVTSDAGLQFSQLAGAVAIGYVGLALVWLSAPLPITARLKQAVT